MVDNNALRFCIGGPLFLRPARGAQGLDHVLQIPGDRAEFITAALHRCIGVVITLRDAGDRGPKARQRAPHDALQQCDGDHHHHQEDAGAVKHGAGLFGIDLRERRLRSPLHHDNADRLRARLDHDRRRKDRVRTRFGRAALFKDTHPVRRQPLLFLIGQLAALGDDRAVGIDHDRGPARGSEAFHRLHQSRFHLVDHAEA